MFKFKYLVNGVEVAVSFEDYRDMVLFVAANRIKDEDFVSIDLGAGEIGGGIDGLANYVVDKITKEKEEEAKEAEECCENIETIDISFLETEDKYVKVDGVSECEDGLLEVQLEYGLPFKVFPEDRFRILKHGSVLEYEQFDDARVIRVRAKYLHAGDIIVND